MQQILTILYNCWINVNKAFLCLLTVIELLTKDWTMNLPFINDRCHKVSPDIDSKPTDWPFLDLSNTLPRLSQQIRVCSAVRWLMFDSPDCDWLLHRRPSWHNWCKQTKYISFRKQWLLSKASPCIHLRAITHPNLLICFFLVGVYIMIMPQIATLNAR